MLFLSTAAWSQTVIEGTVVDRFHKPVGYATVTLLRRSDSSLVKGGVTDASGAYNFPEIPAGTYFVQASMIGRKKDYSASFKIMKGQKVKKLLPLVLRQQSGRLKGINVKASKPLITYKPGKVVLNVNNDLTSAGNTALGVLKKIPGVMVSDDGEIMIRGKSGANLLINGRSTHLSTQQLIKMLQTMPAEKVSQIEVMTHPSAKYDAEGKAGIINLKLKKDANAGLNGTIMAGWGQALYPQASTGINLNYKRKNVYLYGGYHFGHRSESQNLTLRREYHNDKDVTTERLYQPSFLRHESNGHRVNLGMDIDVDEQNHIGFLINSTWSNNDNTSRNISEISTGEGQLTSSSQSKNKTDNNWHNQVYNLHYKHAFDTSGTYIKVNLDYSDYKGPRSQYFTDRFFDADGTFRKPQNKRKGNILSAVRVRSGKVDFFHPMTRGWEINAGLKISDVTTDNNVKYLDWNNESEKWIPDEGTSNHFVYTEHINAAYVSLSKEIGNGWSAKAGLRGEQTQAKGNQKTTHNAFQRNHFKLFPTVFLQKTVDENHQLEFAYSRRISRPDYQRLNPFRYYIDPYTYQMGNPQLEPELTRSIEMTYVFHKAFAVVLGYSRTRNIINETLIRDTTAQNQDRQVIFDTHDNVGVRNQLTLTFNASFPITHWWFTSTSVTPFYNHYMGNYRGKMLDNGQLSVLIHSANTFILPQGFKAQLSGKYHSGMAYGIMKVGGQGYLSAGISKSLLNKKLNLKLNVEDLFNTKILTAQAAYPDMNIHVKNDFNTRKVHFTITWHFGDQQLKVSHHKDTGIEEEQNRIKKGN